MPKPNKTILAIDPGTQERMARTIGDDLSAVRIHDDGLAAAASADVHAAAWTVGHHIAFADDAFRPASPAGDPNRQTTRVVTTTRPETEYRIAFHAHRAAVAVAPPTRMPVLESSASVVTPVSATTPGLGLPARPIPVTP